MIGRYQVAKELGKGAMACLLGKEPKIVRVAIRQWRCRRSSRRTVEGGEGAFFARRDRGAWPSNS